jgi:CheY-like chemotaxis protein
VTAADPPLRVLLVEDEALISMILEQLLEDLGATVVGPAATVAEALTYANATPAPAPDCALLDINLRGEPSWPIADALLARQVPIAFASGYGKSGLEPRFQTAKVLS